jgi:hypothetical protein
MIPVSRSALACTLAALSLLGCDEPEPQRPIRQALPEVVTAAREGIAAGDSAYRALAVAVRAQADKALTTPARSVMDKEDMPASGDRHDFLSPAPLWWPDPEQPDGLPYVWNREGRINPEYYERGDQQAFDEMAHAVQHLALAFALTGEERYASHARTLLRTWFLDEHTSMNPNLNHAWYERGRNTGTPYGIMSLEQLPFLLDAVRMIERSELWSPNDRRGMQHWVASYLTWLTTSAMGRDAARIWNRFGTLHDPTDPGAEP